jgi:uncharacterized surface protein with fasciclin (FAS1) repeats
VVSANHVPSKNIVERAIQVNDLTGSFDTLLTAAQCPAFDGAIVEALATTPDITLFAPTDRAFRQLGLNPSNVCDVAPDALADILTYHVYPGAVSYRQALRLAPTTLTMLNGDDAKLRGGWWNLRIDGARVILPNVRASNGYVHVINKVMTPPA